MCPYAVRDVLDVGQGVDDASFLRRDDQMVEVGVNDDRSKSTELRHQLHKQLPHECVEGTTQRRLVQQALGRTQPPTGDGRSYTKGSSQIKTIIIILMIRKCGLS